MPSKRDKPLSILVFFPEIIGIAMMVLLSPYWCVKLVSQGFVVYGWLVLSTAIIGILAFVWCMIRRWRFVALIVMLAILLAYWLILGRLPPNI